MIEVRLSRLEVATFKADGEGNLHYHLASGPGRPVPDAIPADQRPGRNGWRITSSSKTNAGQGAENVHSGGPGRVLRT